MPQAPHTPMTEQEIENAREQSRAFFYGDLAAASGLAESTDKLIDEVMSLRAALAATEHRG